MSDAQLPASEPPRAPQRLAIIHLALQGAFAAVAALRTDMNAVSPDTAFAIGEALGYLGKAKSLVGRDIDDSTPKDQ